MKRYDANTIPDMAWINDPKRNPKRWVAASTFSGCGGSSTGLKLAGFDVRYASELVPRAAECYRANAAKSTFLDTRDIRDVKPEDILKKCRVKRGELDLLDGSPPCKSFSSAVSYLRLGKKHDEVVHYSGNIKQRVDDLFDNFIRILRGVKPKTFVAENVPGLTYSVNKGKFLEILQAFRDSGYNVQAALVDASQLGVPQKRVRLVFVGVRKDLKLQPVFPKPYGKVLGMCDVVPHIRGMQQAGDVETWRDRWIDGRLPCPTITVMASSLNEYNRIGCSGMVRLDDGTVRKVKISELKRLFGYPKDFELTGSFHQRWERLARSHAPLAVYNIARTIGEQILDKL